MVDIQAMLVFQTVAKCGSFLAASHELNYAQSNISTKIQHLEQTLQAPLFYRYNRGVTLTPKGEVFLQYTTRMLKLLSDAETAMKDNETASGSMAVGSLETIAQLHLPGLLSEYHKNCPEVQLSIHTGVSSELVESVLNRKLDAAFIAGSVTHPELTCLPFRKETLCLAIPFPIASPEELTHHSCTLLGFSKGCYYRSLLEQFLQEQHIIPDRVFEFNSTGAVVASLCAGLGMALLPQSLLAPYQKDSGISIFKLPEKYSSVQTYFVYRKDLYHTAAFRKFEPMVRNG